jgi:N-acetyl-anhydromuramyl-L-alanine amidase AmpD
MYFMAHIYNDKYLVQGFMSLLKENKMMSIHFMVLKMEACISVVNQDQAFEAGLSNEGYLRVKQSGTQSGLDK